MARHGYCKHGIPIIGEMGCEYCKTEARDRKQKTASEDARIRRIVKEVLKEMGIKGEFSNE